MVRISFLLWCVSVSVPAAAQTLNGAAGRVVNVSGDATVQRAEVVAAALKAGAEIREGDVIRTGKASTVRLLMKDKGVLDLGPGSQLALKQYQVNPQSRSRLASLKLFVGRVWARVSKSTGAGAKFEVETSNAVAGVRGTQFVVNVDEGGATQVTVVEGSVAMSAGGPTEGTMLGAMQRGTVAREGGSISVDNVSQGDVNQLANSVRPAAGSSDGGTVPGGEQGAAPAATPPAGEEQGGTQDDQSAPAEEAPQLPDLPPVELDPGAGNTRVRGQVEVRN